MIPARNSDGKRLTPDRAGLDDCRSHPAVGYFCQEDPGVVRASQRHAARLEAHRPGLDLRDFCAWFPRPESPSASGLTLLGLSSSVRDTLVSNPSVMAVSLSRQGPGSPLGALSFWASERYLCQASAQRTQRLLRSWLQSFGPSSCTAFQAFWYSSKAFFAFPGFFLATMFPRRFEHLPGLVNPKRWKLPRSQPFQYGRIGNTKRSSDLGLGSVVFQ